MGSKSAPVLTKLSIPRTRIARWSMSVWLVAGGLGLLGSGRALAVSARYAFEQAYDNVASGDWYRDRNNETATLAWGEAYVMMGLAAMFRATGDPLYLDRLAWHADGVLLQRDDARGVSDYRGVSGACWRDLHYQPNDEPYCYVVHSGQLCLPLVDFARLVRQAGLERVMAYDGQAFGDKADAYVTACEQTVAYHEDQWNSSGYYVFRPDASFLPYAGRDLPLNQSNALGRVLFALYDVTGTSEYLVKATALAVRFRNQVTIAADGSALWNYWGGAYEAYGEDISHAALNLNFALDAADHGAAFTEADIAAMAATFTERIYRDDETFADRIGGGSAVNGSSYRPQIGRWVPLTPVRSSIYAAIRQAYEQDYPPDSVGSGSILLGWAYLAQFEPISCTHFFYYVDWADEGSHQRATACCANILTVPSALDEPCLMAIQAHVQRSATVAQWDGQAYHDLLIWTPTSGFETKYLAYEPAWPHVYWQGGVLFQFADSFSPSEAIEIQKAVSIQTPTITSTPPRSGDVGTTVTYDAQATGDEPLWWRLVEGPSAARMDHATGTLTWLADRPGPANFRIAVDNDFGTAEQVFVVQVEGAGSDAGPQQDGAGLLDGSLTEAGSSSDAGPTDGGTDGAVLPDGALGQDAAEKVVSTTACSCRAGTGGGFSFLWWLMVVGLLVWRLRKRKE